MAGFLVGDRPSYTPTVDTFNGTGAQTAFTLTQETTTDAAIVFISGVGQLPTGAYSISGTTLTFTSAPPSGTSNIWVTYNQPTGTTAIPSDGSISTAKLADDAVTLAKMAGGTDGNLITFDANGDPAYVATGTSGQVLTSNGAGAAPTMQTLAASVPTITPQVATTSGTTISLATGLTTPKRISIMFEGVGITANSAWGIRIGDSVGIETTGYHARSMRSSTGVGATTYFIVEGASASGAGGHSGTWELLLADEANNTWIESYVITMGGSATIQGGGHKSLSSTLTQLELYTTGGTFDKGSANITWE
jgi:hypothetical protein